VAELAYSRPEAAEFGTAFAPPGDNLLLTGGSAASLADMVAGTRRGLLLTCLWYIREVDPETLLLTGLTRDGVYLVDNGEVVAEVDHNFRFNHSPLDVVRRRRRWAPPSARCRASGRTGSPAWPCPRCGCRS
jgi:predicted Zn-dependent protease